MTHYFNGIIRYENGKQITTMPFCMKIGIEICLPALLYNTGMTYKEICNMLALKEFERKEDFTYSFECLN